MPAELVTVIVALISLVGTITVAFVNRGKLDKDKAVELERRLTLLESGQFTDEDRRCLQELNVKVGVLWGYFERGLPESLKSMQTPRYDALLDIARFGFQNIRAKLSITEQNELIEFVRQDYQKARMEEKGDRMLRAGLYLVMLESELGKKAPEEACRGISFDYS